MNLTVSFHTPALLSETFALLAVKPDGKYLDGTLGGGGHFRAIAEALNEQGAAIGIDRDPEAIAWNQSHAPACRGKTIIEQKEFSRFDEVLAEHAINGLDGMLLDLGISSHQIDDAQRGFSYMQQCDLDMRMNPRDTTTAAELLNTAGEEELAQLLRTYGEVNNAPRMARAIVAFRKNRPLKTADDLRLCLQREYGPNLSIKALSKLFQALRIAVNRELDELQVFLAKSLDHLQAHGRLAIIAYHSLEDRIVKNFMRDEERDCICPPSFPVCRCDHRARLARLTGKAVRPSAGEVAVNPRSRSARLRAAEKLEQPARG
jgi:16S rRNA (cytosine1402-N4)-methyltransferase